MPDYKLSKRPAQPAVTMRKTVPVEKLPDFLAAAYCESLSYIRDMGAQPAGMPFACYRNMDVLALDVEAGFPTSRALPPRGDLLAGEVPAGQYAGCLHLGSYDSLSKTYEGLMRWIAEQGLQPAGATYEFYYSEPGTPPDQTRTQVLIAIKA